MPRRPDPALRRLLQSLRAAPAEDLDDVLDGLSPQQRSRVRALLAGGGDGSAGSAVESLTIVDVPPGLSPWLRDRLAGKSEPGAPDLGASAQDALRQAVAAASSRTRLTQDAAA